MATCAHVTAASRSRVRIADRVTLDGFIPPLIVLAVAIVAYVLRLQVVRGGRARFGRYDAIALIITIVVTAGLERAMGRPWTFRNGPVRLWSGNITSDQNSQQVADPYTFTHITHGALFYGVTRLALPRASMPVRLLAAVGLESAWEAYENTDAVVERYRTVTISLGYFGDSVLNSVSDILACLFGFWLTTRLPRQITWTWVIVVEVLLAFWIRDNLTLNILMLVYPLDVIRTWQAGA